MGRPLSHTGCSASMIAGGTYFDKLLLLLGREAELAVPLGQFTNHFPAVLLSVVVHLLSCQSDSAAAADCSGDGEKEKLLRRPAEYAAASVACLSSAVHQFKSTWLFVSPSGSKAVGQAFSIVLQERLGLLRNKRLRSTLVITR